MQFCQSFRVLIMSTHFSSATTLYQAGAQPVGRCYISLIIADYRLSQNTKLCDTFLVEFLHK